MNDRNGTRRAFLGTIASGSGAAVAALTPLARAASVTPTSPPVTGFRFSLNSSTLRGQKLGLRRFLEVARTAGYDGVELWLDEIHEFLTGGRAPNELRQLLADSGLVLENVIAFPKWVVDDEATRRSALEGFRHDVELVAALGSRRIAAPPAGANKAPRIDLRVVAERYRAVLDIASPAGVTALLEFWGSSTNLSQLAEALFVAAATDNPGTAILCDLYHLHRGGSGFGGLHLLSAPAAPIIHVNDYPAGIPREALTDAVRVFPGDGAAPMSAIGQTLARVNPQMTLSLELFNTAYYARDPLEVARTGREKMQAHLGPRNSPSGK